jgi:hypothetical protein
MDTVAAQVFLLAVTSMAAYRLWRLIGYDDVTDWLRRPFEPYTTGWRSSVYNGATCPWCLGSWVAFAAVAAADWATSVWLPFAQAGAAAVLVGALHMWVAD